MKILDPSKNSISSFDDWANIFLGTKKAIHWKEGRSAWSIADYIFNKNGQHKLESIISDIVSENVTFETAVIEKETRFDRFGHGREHDLGISGTTASGKSVFIGVEAKVDESFGDVLTKSYLKSKAKQIAGISTNAPVRIEELIQRIFRQPDETVFELRYQLFYATIGTVAEGADISILFVLVFKTELYDELLGIANYKDYMGFMIKAGAERIAAHSATRTVHRLQIDGKELIAVYDYVEHMD